MEEIIEEIKNCVQQIVLNQGQCLIAIDGRCASGKSTLALQLSKELNSLLFHMDDYFLRPEQRTPARYAEPGSNVDRERVEEEIIIPYKKHQRIVYYPFDCRTMQVSKASIQKPWAPVAIVEGSYSCHPALVNYYDYKIFMNVETEEQMERIQKRNPDKVEAFIHQWIPYEEKYFDQFKPEEQCDLIIDTSRRK